jgi:hypothetical protein
MTTPTDIDDRLRAAHARIPPPGSAATARAEAVLARAATARRRRPRWRIGLAAAATLSVALAALLALLPGRVDSPVAPPQAQAARACLAPTPPAVAGPCLRAMGDVAAAQRGLAAGKVIYQRNTFTIATAYVTAAGGLTARPGKAAYAIARTVPEEIWLAPDGSGRYAYGDESAARPAGPADERAWRASGSPDLDALMGPAGGWGPKVQDLGRGRMDASMLGNSTLGRVLPKHDPLSVLPREPRALTAFLWEATRKQRGVRDRNTFGTDVTTFLRYPRTPPQLRAALLEVFATLPGTRRLGRIRDGAGRPAAGIRLPDDMNDGRTIVAFDPATARLVAEGTSDGDGGVRWDYAYAVRGGAVGRIGERP